MGLLSKYRIDPEVVKLIPERVARHYLVMPVSKIKKWLESGKVNFQGTVDSTAWSMAKFIAQHGSKLHRDGGRTDIITPAISGARLEALTNDIADASLNLIVTDIDDWIDGVTNDKQ